MSVDPAQAAISNAAAYMLGRAALEGAAGTTLQTALAEAIYDIDSTQGDAVVEMRKTSSAQFDEGLANARMGKLQRVQAMRTQLFGDGTDQNIGVFATLRKQRA